MRIVLILAALLWGVAVFTPPASAAQFGETVMSAAHDAIQVATHAADDVCGDDCPSCSHCSSCAHCHIGHAALAEAAAADLRRALGLLSPDDTALLVPARATGPYRPPRA